MKKILIIEDEPLLGDVLSQKLLHEGYEVTLVRDGKEGLDKIHALMPDLVLLDIILPSMNGYEILEAKHADATISDIPVVIISNSGQPVEIRRALALGVVDYMVKAQFDPDEVLAKVRGVFDGKTHQGASEERLKGKTVMWVEDDSFINDILTRKLTSEGCNPMNAHDGEQALELLKTYVPDILLLDLVLPGMSGFDILEKIKADPTTAKIPVIVFSNLGQQSDIDRAMKLGAKKHLIKAEMDIGEVVNEILAIIGTE